MRMIILDEIIEDVNHLWNKELAKQNNGSELLEEIKKIETKLIFFKVQLRGMIYGEVENKEEQVKSKSRWDHCVTGEFLDKVALRYGVTREENETDEQLKKRIDEMCDAIIKG